MTTEALNLTGGKIPNRAARRIAASKAKTGNGIVAILDFPHIDESIFSDFMEEIKSSYGKNTQVAISNIQGIINRQGGINLLLKSYRNYREQNLGVSLKEYLKKRCEVKHSLAQEFERVLLLYIEAIKESIDD